MRRFLRCAGMYLEANLPLRMQEARTGSVGVMHAATIRLSVIVILELNKLVIE